MSTTETTVARFFALDENAANETAFAENFPVEDNHTAALAIDQAAHSEDVIMAPEGWTLYADLLADFDGNLDAYRVLVQPPGVPFLLAGTVESIPWPEGADTMDVLRSAVTTANEIVAAYTQR